MSNIHEAYPYLRVHNTAEAIDFYGRAFGATELFRLTEPSGRIGHASRDEIFQFIRSKRLAVISTTHSTGGPQAALIGFAFDTSLGLVFDTAASSRKARNLRVAPLAALVIGWDDETSLQMEGVATEPAGATLKKAKSLYFDIWPDGRDRETWPDITYFVVQPRWIRFCRYAEPPTTEELVFGSPWNRGL